MNRTLRLLVNACVLLPALALAQGASAPTADKPAVTFDEVERGFYFAVQAGPSFVLNPPAAADTPRPLSPGQTAQVEMGVDIGEFLRFGVFVSGSANRAGAEYEGFSGRRASGDFSMLTPGASLRVMFLGLKDAQDVQRSWFYLRGGAGYALFSPKQLLPDPDILVFAGPGFEYYTRLRHFSVGIEVTGTYLVSSGAMGFALTPSLRYAF
ncbi:MAG: adventurous gliding motility protein CglE [Myxococcaceae bacterium]|nr:adventurous gliding motility protein CglE [Myxococcaceae bacterium]